MSTPSSQTSLFYVACRCFARWAPALLLGLLGGCTGAPALVLAGAYFPAWLVCALLGVAAAVLARVLMLRSGYAQTLPWQLWVCSALGSVVAVVVWTIWVGV